MLRFDKRPLTEHPCYFRGIVLRSHSVPIVEKFVERAKANREPTQGYRPYRTAKTAVGISDEWNVDHVVPNMVYGGVPRQVCIVLGRPLLLEV